MFIKHLKKVPEDRRAIAPYNFVELPDTLVEAEPLLPNDCYYPNRHTGKIECRLTTESPLYIRCGFTPTDFAVLSDKNNGHLTPERRCKRAEFFINPANQCPTIPGSSLRGMLRTLVEIASYGKLHKVSNQQLIYRAVGDTTSLGEKYRVRLLEKQSDNSYSFLMQAGYIVKTNNNWAIQPAQQITKRVSFARIEQQDIPRGLKPWHNCKNAYEIAVTVEPVKPHTHNKGKVVLRYAKAKTLLSSNQRNTESNGVLVKTGWAPRKHMEFVFGMPDKNHNNFILIPDKMIQEYKDQITDGQINILGKEGALQEKQPVFYVTEGGNLVFWGHAMMFRLPYKSSVTNFIPDKLQKPEELDLAESIFGFVRDGKQDKNKARAGRICISDAVCDKTVSDNIWFENRTITPKILASPKPTTFQHYLVQNCPEKKELKHYAVQPSEETVIRGHKLYWHKGSVGNTEIKEHDKAKIAKAPKQYTEIKPIKAGISFKFTIHFENLSNVELGAMLWVLNLAGDKNYRLSLGMGKPLGMGAVKISHELWLCDRVSRYTSLFQGNLWATGDRLATDEEAQKCIKDFEGHVVKGIGEDSPSLKDVPRIQMLLAMLSWPGLSRNKARYMEIERDIHQSYIGTPKPDDPTINEYKERPVLPTPLQVMGWEDKRIIETTPGAPSSSVKKTPSTKKSNYNRGQVLDAEVFKTQPEKKGLRITYKVQCEIEGTIICNEYIKGIEPLPIGQQVKVEITDLKEDGSIRKVKLAQSS